MKETLKMVHFDMGYPGFPHKPILPGLRPLSSEDFKINGKRIAHCPYLEFIPGPGFRVILWLNWLELDQMIASLNPLAEKGWLYWAPNLPSKSEVKSYYEQLKISGNVQYIDFQGDNI